MEKKCHAQPENESQLPEHYLPDKRASPLTREGDNPPPNMQHSTSESKKQQQQAFEMENGADCYDSYAVRLVSEKSGRSVLFDYVYTFPRDL